ncbi:MAG: helix-turn-helix domain-containing protein [Synergistaceae bacterium]|nr:helix-turn-helix domain-containing protein [Synergistaceae bacterium]
MIYEERKYLQQLWEEGYGIRKIARSLGRSPSSCKQENKKEKQHQKEAF